MACLRWLEDLGNQPLLINYVLRHPPVGGAGAQSKKPASADKLRVAAPPGRRRGSPKQETSLWAVTAARRRTGMSGAGGSAHPNTQFRRCGPSVGRCTWGRRRSAPHAASPALPNDMLESMRSRNRSGRISQRIPGGPCVAPVHRRALLGNNKTIENGPKITMAGFRKPDTSTDEYFLSESYRHAARHVSRHTGTIGVPDQAFCTQFAAVRVARAGMKTACFWHFWTSAAIRPGGIGHEDGLFQTWNRVGPGKNTRLLLRH